MFMVSTTADFGVELPGFLGFSSPLLLVLLLALLVRQRTPEAGRYDRVIVGSPGLPCLQKHPLILVSCITR